MKPDYGFNLFQSGLRNDIAHNFYDIQIDHISRIDSETISTMINLVKGGVEFAASFDLASNAVLQLFSGLPHELQKVCAAWLADPNTLYKTLDFPSPIVIKHIQATLGAIQSGQNGEKFVPFVVQIVA